MIDLHCHLCFGVDDGPKDPEEALALARALSRAGVTEVACTSHWRPGRQWLNDAQVQDQNHLALDRVLAQEGVSLTRHGGAEHYLDADLPGLIKRGQAVPLGQSSWLLVELPYEGKPPDLMGLLFAVRKSGHRILLAHLERYPYVVDDEELLQRIVDAGYAIQINLGSVAGAYSRAHKKSARALVKAGRVAVAAGDCHHARDVDRCIVKGRAALAKWVGEPEALRLTVDNPQKILNDAQPEDLGHP
jgi:protein-tyrosine phosphatase